MIKNILIFLALISCSSTVNTKRGSLEIPQLQKIILEKPQKEKLHFTYETHEDKIIFIKNQFKKEVEELVNNAKNDLDFINFQENYIKALENYIEKMKEILSKEQND